MTDPKRARCFEKTPDGKNAWAYAKSEATNLDALFKRVRRQQKEEAAQEAAKQAAHVTTIKRRA